MDKRVEFQIELECITPNVYFQPPSNITMKFPAIKYSRKNIKQDQANNGVYNSSTAYEVTVIDRNPDSPIATSLMKLQHCRFDRQFTHDGLNNITFIIYY